MADNVVHHTPNMSGDAHHKPPLATPGDKDEPSSEWASSTLNALGPITTEPYPPDKPFNTQTSYASLPPTPGDKFPGAYPRGPINPAALSQDAEYVKEAASHALETAKGYVYSAGEVVGGYLPKSVAAYFPQNGQNHHTDDTVDPNSEELPKPHAEFLGNAQVPGEIGTTPVGIGGNRRPEDNSLIHHDSETMRDAHLKIDDQVSTTASSKLQGASTNASTRSLVGSRVDTWSPTPANTTNESQGEDMRNADGSMKTSSSASERLLGAESLQHHSNAVQERKEGMEGMERPDFEHRPEEARRVNAPPVTDSTDSNFAAPHVSLPTTTGREHLTIVDEEKKFPSTTRPSAHQDSIGSNIATPGHENPGYLSASFAKGKEREHLGDVSAATGTNVGEQPKIPSNGTAIDAGTAGDIKNAASQHVDTHNATTANTKPNTNTNATPAQNGTATTNGPASTPATKDLPDTPNHHNAAATGTSNSPTKSKMSSTNSKPGFMDKLRGEMKIISGKLEHSTEKVEEGRRMMGKTPKLEN